MAKVSSLALGVVTAVGGFIDMGELVTCSQAGAQYRFALIWTIVVGTLGIIVYGDTAGRVAIASGRSVFDLIRERLGFRLGLIPLASALLVNVLTLVIEIAGMALVLQIITGFSYLWWFPVAAAALLIVLWFASFKFVENSASLLGLTILIFVVAAIKLATPWGEVARQAVLPTIPHGQSLAAYGFAAVSLIGAFMTPFETYFYSSGAIEEKWDGGDIVTNRITTILGMSFGALIAVAMMVVAAQTFFPHTVQPQTFGSIRVPLVAALGALGACGLSGGRVLLHLWRGAGSGSEYRLCRLPVLWVGLGPEPQSQGRPSLHPVVSAGYRCGCRDCPERHRPDHVDHLYDGPRGLFTALYLRPPVDCGQRRTLHGGAAQRPAGQRGWRLLSGHLVAW